MHVSPIALCLAAVFFIGIRGHAAVPMQDPWEDSYGNLDATGAHVLGCWKFDELPLCDATGHGAQLTLTGASLSQDGRFGGGLACGRGNDATRHAAVVKSLPRHSPAGAFSAEMWIRMAAEADPRVRGCLLDKQGAQMEGFCWSVTPASERGLRRMTVRLGFGTFAKDFESEPLWFAPGDWRHVAFTYDGAGTVAFFLDSQPVGLVFEERCGPAQTGTQPLSIGDSLATPASFPGDVDEVRLCSGVRGFSAYALEISGVRHVWQRMERPMPVMITCRNLRPEPLLGGKMTYVVAGVPQSFIFPDLQPGMSQTSELGPETSLRPGVYSLEVVMGSGFRKVSRKMDFQIVARRPRSIPVIIEGADVDDLQALEGLGCTDWAGMTNLDAPYLGAGERHHHLKVQPRMDAGLVHGLRTVAALVPWRALPPNAFQPGLDDASDSTGPNISAAVGNLAALTAQTGQRLMVAYRDYQTWSGVWLNMAPRRNSQPGASATEREAYRQFSGQDIPVAARSGGGVDWKALPDFPASREVPDDNPILKYYRWFWSGGNGWKGVNEAWYGGMDRRRQERSDVWTLHEPAVRQPSITGADVMCSFIGDEPLDSRNPFDTGLCMDQLLAMSAAAGGRPGVFGILPLGWEREKVSPYGEDGTGDEIVLADQTAPARLVSLAPAILKSSVWTALARPLSGLVLTDWPALRMTDRADVVKATHRHAYRAFCELASQVIRPLGPMLARRQPLKASVAVLESFTSQMMAGKGLYRGGSPQTLEVLKALQQAHIQADIVYEELLAAGGLEGLQVLIMTDCDVLPASLVEKIRQWQQAGGKILADGHLCPALKADALVTDMPAAPPQPKVTPDQAVQSTEPPPEPLTLVQNLHRLCLDLGWKPLVSCDQPDVILHASRSGEATVLFVINDRREAGTYVGQHGRVQEAPLPVNASLNLGHDKVNVYDLTGGGFLLPKREDSGLTIPLPLGPSEGRVLLLSPEPLLEMQVEVPETARRGYSAEVKVRLTTSGGRPMPAAIPVAVTIRDADGSPAEFDGHHVVENGELTVRLDLARNETPGTWEIRVRELASGMNAVKWMRVTP